MADQREGGIAWTDETWNPLRGCSRVSEGCRNCYAETVAGRFSGPGQPYEGLVARGMRRILDPVGTPSVGRPRWNGQVRFLPEKLSEPLHWTRPRMVFVNSMSDLFHESVPFETIAAIFGVMAASPRHTFQVLTKRPERAREWFRWALDQEGNPVRTCVLAARAHGCDIGWPLPGAHPLHWPLPNVWLGVSVEDQSSADARIPLLLETPSAVRWVSYEPALGPVDFDKPRCDICGEAADCVGGDGATPFCNEHEQECSYGHWLDPLNGGLNWVVVGGESGPGARPFDLAWARNVIAQANDTGCRVFVKQLGAKPTLDGQEHRYSAMPPFGGDGGPITYRKIEDRKGDNPNEWPEDLRVREFPR